MKLVIEVAREFGTFCADADSALEFRHLHVDPLVEQAREIVFDFAGVRNMNSSFSNALIANLFSSHPNALGRVKFRNCRANVRLMIESAIDTGMMRVG